jgi:chromatin remodeling complex protein RSC6
MLNIHYRLFKKNLIYIFISRKMTDKMTEVKKVKSEKKLKGDKKDKSSKKTEVVAEVVAEVVVEEVVAKVVVESTTMETGTMETGTMETGTMETGTDEVRCETFVELNSLMETFRSHTSLYLKESKLLMKKMEKEYTKMAKKYRKKKKGNSGFDKMLDISNKLCDFMNVPSNTQKSRKEVLKAVHNYINDNELKNPADKKTILPDTKLEDLLNCKGQEVKYFGNLQTFLKPHFLKSVETSA